MFNVISTQTPSKANRWLLLWVVLATAAVFLFDCLLPRGYAVWVFYLIPLLLTGRRRRLPLVLASLCTVLLPLGFFLSPGKGNPQRAIINRTLGVGALWAGTVLLTRRQQAEEALQLSEEKFQKAFQAGPDAVSLTLLASPRVLEVNDAFLRFTGYQREEVVGHSPLELGLWADPAQRESVLGALRQGRRVENEEVLYRTKSGEQRVALLSADVIRIHGQDCMLAICGDITERKRTEQRFRSYFELPLVGMAVTSPSLQFLEVNDKLCEILGRSREELRGTTWDVFIHRDDVVANVRLLDEVLAGRSDGYSLDDRFLRPDGNVVHAAISARCVRTASGRVDHLVLIVLDISERKRAEEALQESESKFRTLAETAACATYLQDGERFLYVNPASETISGYTRAELLRMSPFDLVHPDFRDAARARALARLRGESLPAESEFPIVTKSGEPRWLDFRVSVTSYEGLPAILATGFDVTDRKRVEEALRRSERQNALILAAAGEGIYGLDSEGKATFINPEGARLLGYAPHELVGQQLHAAIHHTRSDGTPYPQQECPIHAAFQDGRVHSIRGEVFWRKNGNSFPAEYTSTPLLEEGGEPVGAVVVFRDITDHKRAEEALARSEAALRSLIDKAPYGIYRSSLAGRFVSVNPALVTMLGYDSAAEVLALYLARDLYADPEMRARLIHQYQRTKRVVDVEVPWKRKDGKIITVRLSGRAVLNQKEETEGFEMIAEDVTERQQLEEEFRQAQKMEAVGRLAGGIAHDFNNLLGVIMLSTDRLLDRLPPRNPLRGKAEEIRDAANRGASLTYELLAFSRKQVLQPQILDVNAVIADTIKMLQPIIGEDIELNMVQASDLGYVKADPAQVGHVLVNLAVNARDAMPKGGRIVIETANAELDARYASQHIGVQPGRYVMVTVSDTGIGMDRTTQARMFEPFFTTKDKEKGTGLGLSTVYGIVKQSGGHIWVYSELGYGSTFKIFFPRVEQELATSKIHTRAAVPRGGSETILLVEDDVSLRRETREVLQESGYSVLEAGTAAQAMKIAKEHEGPIHLLLTDVVLPKRSGRFLAESLRSSRSETKVLYVSGYTDEVTFRSSVVAPGEAFLQKPFTAAGLARKVREVLEDRPGPDSPTAIAQHS